MSELQLELYYSKYDYEMKVLRLTRKEMTQNPVTYMILHIFFLQFSAQDTSSHKFLQLSHYNPVKKTKN